MGGYFHGWRRKTGLVTLAIALLFLGGWMRSLVVNDRIEFSKFINITKKNKHLAGLAIDRQSLVVLVYNVEEMLCRPDENAVSCSSLTSQAEEVEKIERIPVSWLELAAMGINQPTTVCHPTAVAIDQPTMLTNPVADQESALSVTGTGAPMFTPFPKSITASIVSNPAAEISIRTISTQPVLSVLSSVSISPLVAVPFWSVVIPLTLISACLLLSKQIESFQP